ncbi:MAG TPA: TIGR03560 family F420-dependent LLM class oxidoreductase [Actinomycetota bacterium]|jgi:F420-dependent oxidoreductase-like protein|nr:TIGR03560 family F420-dependent LLM class oxidoreductase [Actinomycetota bacterium]
MRIGLALPHFDFSAPDGAPVSWERLAEVARRAEALGFDSLWVSDHFFLSLERYGGRDEAYGSPEALTALAALATVTERARLGTLVLCAGFRHPALLAKSAVTVDLLSRGRLDLGLGAGWLEDEYRAFGYDFGNLNHRFEVLEETLVAVGLLLAEGPATWEGRHFRLHEAYARPRPMQEPRPPLWVGGKGGPRILRLVARHADGWNTVWAWTPQAYAERVRTLQRACEREGRDPATVRRSVGLYTLVGEDPGDLSARYRALQAWSPGGGLDGQPLEAWGRDKLIGTPQQILDRLAEFAELGVEEVICSMASVPFALYDESALDLLAERVMPAARTLEPIR